MEYRLPSLCVCDVV